MNPFVAVDDQVLSSRIAAASSRVVFIAPAVSRVIVESIRECLVKPGDVRITMVLDPDEDPYRLGHGDREGLEQLKKLLESKSRITLRAQTGLRVGVLVVDHDVLVWSPTARAVEGERTGEEPNGIDLSGTDAPKPSVENEVLTGSGVDKGESSTAFSAASLAGRIEDAVIVDDTGDLQDQGIGRSALVPEQLEQIVEVLTRNPPAPFDLARKTRVFATRFQFVEFERRGAEWTKREIKLSSLLLNPDLPDELHEVFETRVKPYSHQGDTAVHVPVVIQGQIAYNRDGEGILAPMTQTQIERAWRTIYQRYIVKLTEFGWLIRRVDKERFVAEVDAYSIVLKRWVEGFRARVDEGETVLVERIVSLVRNRASGREAKEKLKDIDIEETIRSGIRKMRVTEPMVKLVFKDIAWESTRDDEFTAALRKVLKPDELTGWFEEFVAAKERVDPSTA